LKKDAHFLQHFDAKDGKITQRRKPRSAKRCRDDARRDRLASWINMGSVGDEEQIPGGDALS
jgi:hypothetical protein